MEGGVGKSEGEGLRRVGMKNFCKNHILLFIGMG